MINHFKLFVCIGMHFGLNAYCSANSLHCLQVNMTTATQLCVLYPLAEGDMPSSGGLVFRYNLGERFLDVAELDVISLKTLLKKTTSTQDIEAYFYGMSGLKPSYSGDVADGPTLGLFYRGKYRDYLIKIYSPFALKSGRDELIFSELSRFININLSSSKTLRRSF